MMDEITVVMKSALRRKKALIAASCAVLLVLVVLACALSHRSKAYDGGTIIVDSETRTELSESDIAEINQALSK